ncbi:MAG: alcohol dehydrogenase catalytic domain-containing protein [Armatimonadetes bacterium]|nr:alcohol dehydrogenase catalytic domain-containing protein [Armatimonadota bacterium]
MPDTDLYAAYKTVPDVPPSKTKRWHLYGAGLENVGRNGAPETVPLPEPGDREIVVRHDAVGICYSDIKIVNLGGDHPRLIGRDLAANPVVMGHEVALTVVNVGAGVADRFAPGDRFIVQADVYYKGKNLAYGYALAGGMAQYGIVTEEVLSGDEGCYLLPIKGETGYAEAALVEPWACVEAAYHWTQPEGGGEIIFNTGSSSIHIRGNDNFDTDLAFTKTPAAEVFEQRTARLGKNALVQLSFQEPMSRPVQIDVGRVHYDGWLLTGAEENKRSDLLPGGITWMIGAAGPMGQMHVARAIGLPEPPRKIVCTDRNDLRLQTLQDNLGDLARERGIELVCLNVRDTAPDHVTLAPDGYNDIVVMVPSIEAIEDGFPRLAHSGVMNVFAGVARGTMATLDISDVATKNVRIVGTSGSTIEDMRRTRDLMEAHQLDTGASVAAIGGLEAYRDGLDAVKTSRFPGKTVIFPQIEGLPLTALPDLQTVRPHVFSKLKNGKFWTHDAEAELLKEAVR